MTITNADSKVFLIKQEYSPLAKAQHYGYYPVQSGKFLPNFNFKREQLFANYLPYGSLNGNNEIFIQELLDYKHPIVLVFYEAQSYSEKVFAAIESLKVDVEVMGGKLILITHAFVKNIQEFSSKNNITVYYDKSNEISETFGLYNPNNTLPSWISGIDDEQAILPAFYVIGADRRVTYHLVDFDVQLFNDPIFLENNFVRNLLSTVHHSEKQFYKFNWQKRVVS